jgi:hypothetical protein
MSTTTDATSRDDSPGGGDELNPAQAALIHAVDEGRTLEVARLVRVLSPAERRGCLPALRERRQRVRDRWSDRGDIWSANHLRLKALLVAGAGCNTAASAAAQWIASAEVAPEPRTSAELLMVLSDREPRWIAEVARRLADRRTTSWSWWEFPLVERLVRISGCPVPTGDGFVARWVRERTRNTPALPYTLIDGKVVPAEDVRLGTLLDRLCSDDFLDVLVPRLFEVADIGAALGFTGNRPPVDSWPQVLAMLAGYGRLDRGMLIDGCLSRLLRGERLNSLRGFVAILEALAPTEDEQAARVTVYLRLLPDAHSTVATLAQKTLIALDDAGRLDPEILLEASRLIVSRPEKKLLRAQLSWLGKAARRGRDRAGEIVLAAAEFFGSEDTEVAERALTLVGGHLEQAGDSVRADVWAAAATLPSALRDRAAEMLGLAQLPGDDVYDDPADLLPPVPEPRPLPPALGTAAEVAEEVAAILAGERTAGFSAFSAVGTDVSRFELALDGLVRHAFADRPGLVEALRPIADAYPMDSYYLRDIATPGDIRCVVAALLGEIRVSDVRDPEIFAHWHPPFSVVLAVRLREVARQMFTGPLPFLLATPTTGDGRLDPAELVARLEAYEQSSVDPGDRDLDQALLRVDPAAVNDDVLARAQRLTTPAGHKLATWLAGGGLPAPQLARGVDRNRSCAVLGSAAITPPCELGDAFQRLLTSYNPQGKGDETRWNLSVAHWSAVVPACRELLAIRLQPTFTAAAAGEGRRGGAGLLPTLAEAGGPAGPALHLGLAHGLGARFAEDRTAAVDALLVLAARGDLDAGMLGRDLGEAVRRGTVKPNRLAESAREASRAGAYGTVWSVLAAALPELLNIAQTRGLPDVLAVATECARRAGAGGPIPEVTAIADRPGSSRLVKEARLLRDTLARE